MPEVTLNPAEQAAEEAQARVHACIDEHQSFLLEAGAGAGKTHSLICALRHVIARHGASLRRLNQQVACITFTNVAVDQIRTRVDQNPVVMASTIHAFCWSLIKDFQPNLRELLPQLRNWQERIAEAGGLNSLRIEYELGHPAVRDDHISLGHDDVIGLTARLMPNAKFRRMLRSRYPIVFVDEYQDTNQEIARSFLDHCLAPAEGLLIGFFGDHWQCIYDDRIGRIEDARLTVINKGANFRSVQPIVDALNRIRPELPQASTNPAGVGTIAVFHTNDWPGERLNTPHWRGCLPPDAAHLHVEALKTRLVADGWEFTPEQTRVLMLTNNALAGEQGYGNLLRVFRHPESVVKKEDPYIAFLLDTVEPVCRAFAARRYGAMFLLLGGQAPRIASLADKRQWVADLTALQETRQNGTVGDVLQLLKRTDRPTVPDALEVRDRALDQWMADGGVGESDYAYVAQLRTIPYREIIAANDYIEANTPFSTMHGVKGAEFENVLVVVGGGWNRYDFDQFLAWAGNPTRVPQTRREAFERSRNLFYVVCSRPKKRLGLLFTQRLSTASLESLANIFGSTNVHSIALPNGL